MSDKIKCPYCGAVNPMDRDTCHFCRASLSTTDTQSQRLSGASLFYGYVQEGVTKERVASMSLQSVTKMVTHRRKKKVSALMRDVPLSDAEIAQAMHSFARGTEDPRDRADMTEDQRLLLSLVNMQYDLLREQQAQTRHLKSMNTVIQLWGVLLILGIIGWCVVSVLGSSVIP